MVLFRIFPLKFWAALLLLLMAISLNGTQPAHAQAQAQTEVVVLEISAPVVPAFQAYIERGLAEADRRNAEAVIVVMDTPGGAVDITLQLVQSIKASDVPVIIYVAPRGALAGSAGLFITLAGQVAAMAPETVIGASSPIAAGGAPMDPVAQEKAEEILAAQARSLAQARGPRAVELAEAAVVEARAVSAQEALEADLIDFVAEDVDDLLNQLEGYQFQRNGDVITLHTTQARQVPLAMNPLEQLLIFIANPNVIAILLPLGTLLIFVEVRTPGGWAAGISGTIMVGMALYGIGVLPVNWLGALMIILALALFIMEINTPATFGVLTAVGTVLMAAGLIVLLNNDAVNPFGEISIPLVVGQSVVIGGLFLAVSYFALKAARQRPFTGMESMIGQVGIVTRELAPQGSVRVAGEIWQASSQDGAWVPVGQRVEILQVQNLHLSVKPLSQEQA